MPATAVGAVGVPVNEGDEMVALKAISLIFEVILLVLELTRVSSEFISFALVVTLTSSEVILEVFEAILVALVKMSFVFVVILITFAAILVLINVMLAVLEAIEVGKPVIVDELNPPTLTTVGAVAVPPKSLVN